MMKHPFEVGGSFRNEHGDYEVLGIDGDHMLVRYDDGKQQLVTVATQARIWRRYQDESAPPPSRKPISDADNLDTQLISKFRALCRQLIGIVLVKKTKKRVMRSANVDQIRSFLGRESSPSPDTSWLHPPADVHNSEAWDKFWTDQIAHRRPFVFHEIFDVTRPVIEFMWSRDLHSVLCAGNGLSVEPVIFAGAGLDAVALDLSDFALGSLRDANLDPGKLRSMRGEPLLRSGGSFRFVAGDLFDKHVCSGPFDVVVERRTLRLFGDRQEDGLRALMSRVSDNGCLISHWHNVPDAPDRLTDMGLELVLAWSAEEAVVQFNQIRESERGGRPPVWLFRTSG